MQENQQTGLIYPKNLLFTLMSQTVVAYNAVNYLKIYENPQTALYGG
jgi:hypothetical protein